MSEIVARKTTLIKFIVIFFQLQNAFCYENAYDNAEKRKERQTEPNNRYYQSSERFENRYNNGDRYNSGDQFNNGGRLNGDRFSSGSGISDRRFSSGGGFNDRFSSGSGLNDRSSSNNQFKGDRFSSGSGINDRFSSGSGINDRFRSGIGLNDRFSSGIGLNDRFSNGFGSNDRFSNGFGLNDRFSSGIGLNNRFSSGLRSSGNDRFDNSNRDRFSTNNRRQGSIYASIKPDRRRSTFGNGYDNLGTGRDVDESRRFDSSRDADRFDSFGDRFEEPYSRSYGSSYRDERPYHRRSYYSRRNNDSPVFYERDYFKPHHDERYIEQGQKSADQNFEKASGQKGNSGVAKTDHLVANNEDKKQKKSDSGFRKNEEGTHVDVNNKDKFGETSHSDKNGENKSTLRSNRVLKKGHSTKGFSSHHHKDETGNTTTFFDESSDQGGQTDYKDIADEFGSRKSTEQFSGKEDGKFAKENGGQSGNFGSGYLQDNQKYEKDILSNDNHFGQQQKFGGGGDSEKFDVRKNSHRLSGDHGYSDRGLLYDRHLF